MNRLSRLKIALYLSAIFVAGMVTGAILLFTAGRHMMFAAPRSDRMANRWCDELQTRLKLTPEQLQKIKPIVNDTLEELKATMMDRVSTTISNSNARIAAELTPEQKATFEQMVKEHQEMIRERLGGKSEGAPKTQ